LDIQKYNINFKIQTKMKKVFFSAVALVAFSFAGMANEIVETKIKSIQKENVEQVSETPCYDQYVKDKKALKAAGFSENTSEAIANSDFEDCLEITYGV